MAVIGLPYLMGKLVRFITAKQEAERQRLEQQGQNPGQAGMLPGQHGGGMISANENGEAIDPSKLTFVRALYAYPAADPLELSLQPNDIIAVLSKTDPQRAPRAHGGEKDERRPRGILSGVLHGVLGVCKGASGQGSSCSSSSKAVESSEKAAQQNRLLPQGDVIRSTRKNLHILYLYLPATRSCLAIPMLVHDQ